MVICPVRWTLKTTHKISPELGPKRVLLPTKVRLQLRLANFGVYIRGCSLALYSVVRSPNCFRFQFFSKIVACMLICPVRWTFKTTHKISPELGPKRVLLPTKVRLQLRLANLGVYIRGCSLALYSVVRSPNCFRFQFFSKIVACMLICPVRWTLKTTHKISPELGPKRVLLPTKVRLQLRLANLGVYIRGCSLALYSVVRSPNCFRFQFFSKIVACMVICPVRWTLKTTHKISPELGPKRVLLPTKVRLQLRLANLGVYIRGCSLALYSVVRSPNCFRFQFFSKIVACMVICPVRWTLKTTHKISPELGPKRVLLPTKVRLQLRLANLGVYIRGCSLALYSVVRSPNCFRFQFFSKIVACMVICPVRWTLKTTHKISPELGPKRVLLPTKVRLQLRLANLGVYIRGCSLALYSVVRSPNLF